MRVLVCGDRDWTDKAFIRDMLAEFADGDATIIHGAARGADRLAGEAAAELGFIVVPVPADWESHGRAAGPIRNRRMIELKPDLVLAFHDKLDESKGTKDMVAIARKAGVPVRVVSHTQETPMLKEEQIDMLEAFADKGRRTQIAVDEATERARKKVRPEARETSKAAARSLTNVTRSQQAVLDCFKRNGPMCDSDLIARYGKEVHMQGWPYQSESGLRTRRAELVERPKPRLRDSGKTKTLQTGRESVVWELVE